MRLERKNLILVDSGALFFLPGSVPDASVAKERKEVELKIDLFLKTYNLMGYDAFTPGDSDLSFSIHYLLEKSKGAQFPFLLANLIDNQSQNPVFRPYIMKEFGDTKVGLLGLVSDRYPLGGPPDERGKFHLSKPVEAARKAIAELKKHQCNVIIVVAHMEEDEQKNIALAIPDIHFIVSGYVRKLKREPLVVNNAEILMAGVRGEYLGRMDFSVKKNKEEGEKGLHSQYQIVALWEGYKDHFQTAELIEQYKIQLESLSQTSGKTVIQESGPASQ